MQELAQAEMFFNYYRCQLPIIELSSFQDLQAAIENMSCSPLPTDYVFQQNPASESW